jgi:hypothetical protein
MPFDWGKNEPVQTFGVMSSDEDDSLSDLDSEVPPENAKWATEDRATLQQLGAQEKAARKAQQPMTAPNTPINVNLSDIGVEESPPAQDEDSMSEVEFRLEKAQCYKMLINHQLLSGDTKASEEVEYEVQEFVRNQLGILMGMKRAPEKGLSSQEIGFIVKENLPFSDDEVNALRAVAAKVLNKPSIIVAAPPKALEAPTPALPRPMATVTPAPAPEGAKRSRGRPRKYPCQKCGQMECICKKQVATPTEAPAGPKAEGETKILPDGTKIVEVGNKRYKLIKKAVLYKDGTTGEEEIPMDITPPVRSPARWPTEAEVAMLAQRDAEFVVGKSSNLIRNAIAVSHIKE